LLLVPSLLLVTGWNRYDRSDFRIAEDFSRTLLSSLPPGAHLAASDDNILFVLIYLHLVENVRPDIDLILQGVGDSDLPPLRVDPDTDPLFFTHHPNWNLPEIEVVPVGLVYQTVRSGTRPQPELPKNELEGAWDPAVPKDYLTQNLIGHFHFMLGVSHEESSWPRAESEFRRATVAAPRNDVLFYNLGLIYRRNGLPERALESFRRADEINPRPIPSARPVRAVDREAEAVAEQAAFAEARTQLGTDLDLSSAAGQRELARRLASSSSGAGSSAPDRRLWARGCELRAQELEAGLTW
jgi:tetratricopeptide (TPR) repeat protein